MLASTEDVLERAVTGKVKWYSMRRRYGFIQRDDGAKDIFVHQISRRKSRMVKAYLLKGAQVQFDVVDVGSGIQADKIRTCVRTPNGEQQGGSVVSELTKNSHLSIHSGKNFGTEGRCLCSWHIPAYRWCKDVALCPCRIAREKNKNLEGCMPECQCWCGVTLPVSRYGVVAGRTPRYLSLGAPRQARRSQGRRLWEMQKDQFETTRKKKEAKLKEKMEEDAKRKKKEEFEEHKRLKEEELERQRQLEIMRTRDTKVILTESVSRTTLLQLLVLSRLNLLSLLLGCSSRTRATCATFATSNWRKSAEPWNR
ncbi:hypothetical protein L596_008850 [Steinernema carpocapsae]|uniref:CSD domain-containing protein n=1 Tax=Steinernema carpocapsae TaxID=34508 RepID=A0A4V6A6H4_STECR|nr:hypothetical protein L596_008850 [Steinernema carpocapsae]